MAREEARDRPITIYRAVETQDALNQPVITWSRVAKEWAKVTSIEIQEKFGADRMLSFKTRSFVIRYLSWLTPKHRIVYDGDNYDILSISDIEARGRNHFMKILAEVKA